MLFVLTRLLMFILIIILVFFLLRLFGLTAYEVGAAIREGFAMIGRFFRGLFSG